MSERGEKLLDLSLISAAHELCKLWTSYLTSLHLRFLICRMGIITEPSGTLLLLEGHSLELKMQMKAQASPIKYPSLMSAM